MRHGVLRALVALGVCAGLAWTFEVEVLQRAAGVPLLLSVGLWLAPVCGALFVWDAGP